MNSELIFFLADIDMDSAGPPGRAVERGRGWGLGTLSSLVRLSKPDPVQDKLDTFCYPIFKRHQGTIFITPFHFTLTINKVN